MGRTKRQHYVPKSYLKRFSFDGKLLHTFLINQNLQNPLLGEELKRIWKDISLSDVCLSKDYYTIDEQNPHNNFGLKAMALEKDFFQDFAEPKLSNVIDKWENEAKRFLANHSSVESMHFTEAQRYDLTLCAFIQYHRCPRVRHHIESVDEVIKLHHKISRKEKGMPIESNFKGLDVAFTHADKTYLNPYLWRMFYAKVSSYCLLLRVSENGNFFTSDNPVVIHKLGAKGTNVFNVNFFIDDFSLFFPLTPKIMLEYYCPVVFPEAMSLNNTMSMVSVDYESQVNKYQYINAEKFIFSPKNDFSLFIKPIN